MVRVIVLIGLSVMTTYLIGERGELGLNPT
jgi:hypothetical protein